ncbi:putative prolyl 4-hydroxylase 9 [Prunus yedoensis var. nudiflora]|uniref:procollagen-proline 4-dioxygenase n=1 Tax=Prunus yedoensis var. nudiflora TaxID=2094558 RepID=A0A314ZIF3_PRUYE|nr:putative prolyl 4-hydroxylase 9 [Prunus yedoensis var. nudiflora]
MKVKAKSPKAKFGLPTVFLLCSLFFFAGLFTFTLLSHVSFPQFLSGPRSVTRTLQSEDGENHGPLPQGETGDSFIQSIPFQVLSWKPRALYFPRFATAEQCESVIEMAKTKLRPSALALRKGETAESTKGTRTSSGTFISASEDETGILEIIEEKIARATMLPRTHGEAFNVLRYEIGQKYDSHYDAFNPSEYGQQKSQRFASFLLYLSDVEEGGETMFPFENGLHMGMSYDYKKCIGLKVMPRQGDGLLFYSVLPNGTIDQTSLHGSCPVIKGEKWVATKWIRNQEDLE